MSARVSGKTAEPCEEPCEVPEKKTVTSNGSKESLGMMMLLLAVQAGTSSVQDMPSGEPELVLADPTARTATITVGRGSRSVDSMSTDEISGENSAAGDDYATEDMALVLSVNERVISAVAAYLPWRTALDLRRVSKAWQSATEATVVRIAYSPTLKIPSAFVLCPAEGFAQRSDVEKQLCTHLQGAWKCLECGFWNTENRILCGNRQCQVKSPAYHSAARIFMGQLRKDATVSYLKWLVDDVLSAFDSHKESALVFVENHRNMKTGRGKGCAWAYYRDWETAAQMIRYHHSVFLDVLDGQEGVWVLPPGKDSIAEVSEIVKENAYATGRPTHLPRNALVVEQPEVVEPIQTPAAATEATATPPQNTAATTDNNSVLPPSTQPQPACPPPSSPTYTHNPYSYSDYSDAYAEAPMGDAHSGYVEYHHSGFMCECGCGQILDYPASYPYSDAPPYYPDSYPRYTAQPPYPAGPGPKGAKASASNRVTPPTYTQACVSLGKKCNE